MNPSLEKPQTAWLTTFLEDSLARNLAWIASADAKTAVIFTVATAMFGFLATTAPAYGKWTVCSVTTAIAAAALLLASLGALTTAILPRNRGPKLSLIFFGSVADMEVDAYRRAVTGFDEEAYMEDLVQQAHANAKIAGEKYRWIKYATILLYLSVLPWIVAVYALFRDKS